MGGVGDGGQSPFVSCVSCEQTRNCESGVRSHALFQNWDHKDTMVGVAARVVGGCGQEVWSVMMMHYLQVVSENKFVGGDLTQMLLPLLRDDCDVASVDSCADECLFLCDEIW